MFFRHGRPLWSRHTFYKWEPQAIRHGALGATSLFVAYHPGPRIPTLGSGVARVERNLSKGEDRQTDKQISTLSFAKAKRTT